MRRARPDLLEAALAGLAALPVPVAAVGIAVGLVGAIVGELPTGAQAGLGARLLTGSYYGNTVQIWSALVMAALLGLVLAGGVGLVERVTLTPHGSREMIAGLAALVAALAGGVACLVMLEAGPAAVGFWLLVAAAVALFWLGLETLAKIDKPRWIGALVVPGLFGVLLLWLWQVLTVGFDVPQVLLPAPSVIGHRWPPTPADAVARLPRRPSCTRC